MKKTFRLLFALGCAIVAFSCTQKVDPVIVDDPDDAPVAGEVVTISATLSDQLTKVAFDPTYASGKPTNLALTWEEGDQIRVYNHADRTQYQDFTLDPSYAGAKKGIFTGTAISASSYDVEVINGAFDYASQTQPADGATTGLKYMASASDIADYATIEFANFSSVLAITAKMPSVAAAAAVKSVDITASENIFNGGNALTITLTTPGSDDDILNLFATLPVGNQAVPAGTTLMVRFNAPETEHTVYTRYIELGASALTFTANKLNTINVNASQSDQHAGLTSCDGTTAAKAYLIADPYQVAAINGLATNGSTTFFKLIDDVDMTGVTHNHINTASGYNQIVNFNGNNKTISNLKKDFFYVLKGSVYDLTLDNSNVTARGILAEYIQGSGNVISNVTVSNGKVTSSSSNVGGMVGRINSGTSGQTTATFTNCTVSGTNVKGSGVVGGFIGFADELVSISGCKYTGGTVEASGQYCGGFLGSTADKASVISNCQVENATVKSTRTDDARVGGFVGLSQFSVQIKGCTVGTDAQKVIVNTAEPASGKVLNAGGFVGVNYGTITKNGDVRSKAYVNVVSANTLGQQINIGGFVGFHRGTIEYCDADVDMSEIQGQYIGGFSGYMPSDDGMADNCTVKGSVRGNNYTGGFVGVIDKALSITNCQVLEGTVVVGQSTAGGFAAQIKAGVVEDCSAHVDLRCRGGNDGGFVGALTGGTVQRCSSAGTLSQIEGSNNVFGGFAGYVNGVDLTKCSSTVNISVARNYIGGLIGDFQTANTVSECFYNGTISGPTNVKGGLIGTVAAVAAVITNCYTAGELVGSSGTQVYGGIVGELKTDASVTNCYSTMDFSHAGRATGGIVGRACNGGWNVSTATNNTISKCIAWNPNITFDGSASSSASSGAIVGYTSFKNILNNCYRRYDMVYKNSNTAVGTSCQTSMVDQVDCDGTNWLINGTRPAGGTPAGTSADAQYQAPYYGVAAASTATVSSLAQSLGWDSSVWVFTQDLPRLKWTL